MAVNENEQDRVAAEAAPRPPRQADEQGLLFTDDVSPLPSDTGYRGPTACNAAGITYRQLDYWARTGLVEPTVRGATGSGTQRLYSFRDILILKVVKRLLDAGISLQQIRTAVAAPARARHRRPDPRHPDERRRQRLRVHQQRRGHRPPPGRPGRLRHRHRRRLARDRGHPRRAAERAHRRGRRPTSPATSSPPAGPLARPAERTTTDTTTGPEQTLRARRTSSARMQGREPGGAEAGRGLPVPGLHRRGESVPGQGGHEQPGEERVPGAVGVDHVVHRPDRHVELVRRRHGGRTARPLRCRRRADVPAATRERMKGSGSAIPSSLRSSTSAAVHPVAVEGGRAVVVVDVAPHRPAGGAGARRGTGASARPGRRRRRAQSCSAAVRPRRAGVRAGGSGRHR